MLAVSSGGAGRSERSGWRLVWLGVRCWRPLLCYLAIERQGLLGNWS